MARSRTATETGLTTLVRSIVNRNYNHGNAWSIGLPLVPIRFEFNHPTAAIVSVAGSVNDWHPTTKSMSRAKNGLWMKEAFLPPGDYEYCLVVDGHWIPDPRAQGHVPNPFGGKNSILTVAPCSG